MEIRGGRVWFSDALVDGEESELSLRLWRDENGWNAHFQSLSWDRWAYANHQTTDGFGATEEEALRSLDAERFGGFESERLPLAATMAEMVAAAIADLERERRLSASDRRDWQEVE